MFFKEFECLECMLLETEEWVKGLRSLPRLAVVLDIDDTCIHHHPLEVNVSMWKLYQRILQCNMYVFFVTARPFSVNNYKRTLTELSETGFGRFNGLFLMPQGGTQDIGAFKKRTRLYIRESLGFIIILNVGDRWHDLTDSVRLPIRGECKRQFAVHFDSDSTCFLHLKLPVRKKKP